MKKHILISFVFIVFFSSLPLFGKTDTGQPEEGIFNFHSDIRIDSSGVVQVTEHIEVFADQIEIKRGIFRKIPLLRTDKFGKEKKVGIQLISVLRDGNPENYKSKEADNYLEIYIGNADHILPSGFYDYTITYTSKGHIGFFDDFDELYWNVTGNEWEFSIEKASATIYLPSGSKVLSASCYTGIKGSTEQNCNFSSNEENSTDSISFYTAQRLAPFEGLTVAVSFPQNIIKRPPPPNQSIVFWIQNGLYISSPILLLIFICYCYLTWRKVGKDPYKPTVIPTFDPPRGFSPSALRYLYNKKYDTKTFSSSIINLAVNQFLRIVTNAHSIQLICLNKNDSAGLSKEDRTVLNSLFVSNRSNMIDTSKNTNALFSANIALNKILSTNSDLNKKSHYNSKYSIRGFIIMFILITLNCFLTLNPHTIGGLLMLVLPLLLFAYALIAFGLTKRLFTKLSCITLGIITYLLSLIFVFSITHNIVFSCLLLVLFIIFYIYDYLIKAPTKEEVDILAEIEGFKMYLKTAEEYRLNRVVTTENPTELFEKMLPYAIALDLENEWGKNFNNLFKQADYSPEWYSGSRGVTYKTLSIDIVRNITSDINNAQNRINQSLRSTSSRSSSSSRGGGSSSSSGGSWSSGSRGGGSSGGGGGGGGGGGW